MKIHDNLTLEESSADSENERPFGKALPGRRNNYPRSQESGLLWPIPGAVPEGERMTRRTSWLQQKR